MMKKIWAISAMLMMLLFTTTTYAAPWANPGLLIDVETMKANIDKPDWVVVDCRELKKYLKGHIPGAISLGKRAKKALRDPSSRLFKDPGKYEKILSKVGIGNETHVVFYYGDIKDIPDATVGFWVLEYLGHDKAYVLDGGIDAWRKAGNRLEKKPVKKPSKSFKAHIVQNRVASTAEIIQIAGGNGTPLIDSRSKKEYAGKDIRAVQGGHVPNARNVSHLDTLVKVKDKKTGKMKATPYISPEAVAKHFGSMDKNKRTVAYCQTGTRSTLTYFQMRLLGFKEPANWDDSWRVYGSDLHAANPIEAPNGVQYYNFAKVNKSLKKLTKKVAKLEAAMKKLTGKK